MGSRSANPESTRLTSSEATETLAQTADRLFYPAGVNGVSLAAIRDDSGLSFRRIYKICPSKDDLISLWLRTRHQSWSSAFAEVVDRELAAGSTPVDAVFNTVRAWMLETNFRGCGFINTYAEIAEPTDEHVEIIRDHKHSFATYLDRIVVHGDALAVLIDGAIVQASMFSSLEPIERARSLAETHEASYPKPS